MFALFNTMIQMEAKKLTEKKMRVIYDPKRAIVHEAISKKYEVTRYYVRRCVVNDVRTNGVRGTMIRKDYENMMAALTQAVEQVTNLVLNQNQAI